MTTNSHTPGPWHVFEDSGGGRPPIVFADSWAICNCVTFHGKHTGGEDLANAHLIAAAPELLESAIEFIAQFVEYIDSDYGELPDPTELMAAIAKAKGGAQCANQ